MAPLGAKSRSMLFSFSRWQRCSAPLAGQSTPVKPQAKLADVSELWRTYLCFFPPLLLLLHVVFAQLPTTQIYFTKKENKIRPPIIEFNILLMLELWLLEIAWKRQRRLLEIIQEPVGFREPLMTPPFLDQGPRTWLSFSCATSSLIKAMELKRWRGMQVQYCRSDISVSVQTRDEGLSFHTQRY